MLALLGKKILNKTYLTLTSVSRGTVTGFKTSTSKKITTTSTSQ